MKTAVAVVFACAGMLLGDGLPARSSPADYPAHGSDKGVTVAADVMDSDVVKSSFSTDLEKYAVLEVAVYPAKDGKPVEIATIDFALRVDGRMVRPAEAKNIARLNQKRGQDRSRDIALYPNVGVTTGSWGTGTMIGMGVGIGGNPPGPASSDRDREVMEQELDDKALQEGPASKPVAGYLYFPVGAAKKTARTYELEYELDGVKIKFPIAAKK